MKKRISPLLVFMTLMGAAQMIHALQPDQAFLILPPSAPPLPVTASVLFAWGNTPAAQILSYRLVVSTTPNFSGYNTKTKACNNTCFTATVQKTNYLLPISNAILKADNNYYWRIEATNTGGASLSDIHAFSFGASAPVLDPKFLAAIPNVTAVSVLPTSVIQGTPLTISATLDNLLPAGFVAKVDYGTGNGLLSMTGSGTSYSLAQTPTKLGTQSFNVGIYDNKGVLKSKKFTSSFKVTAPIVLPEPPILSLVSKVSMILKVGMNNVYAIQLSATDKNRDLRLISIDWLDGSSDSINVADGATTLFTHTYTAAGSYTWSATAYDYTDAASNIISQAVTVSVPVIPVVPPVVTPPVVVPPVSTTPAVVTPPRYFEVAEDGTDLPDQVAIMKDAGFKTEELVRAGNNGWACTRDGETKLIWEVKTNDGYLHDKDWTYSWYEPDTTKNHGFRGAENGGVCKGVIKCNTDAYVKAVNAEGLCGQTNWRLPTKKELKALVICPNGLSPNYLANEISDICAEKNPPLDPYNPLPSTAFIDNGYFPNTKTDWYWTSETYIPTLSAYAKPSPPLCYPPRGTTLPNPPTKPPKAPTPCTTKLPIYDSAWNVGFYDGHTRPDSKGNAVSIRLVSDVTP